MAELEGVRRDALRRLTDDLARSLRADPAVRLAWLFGSRIRGASVGSVVKAHTVTESVASKRSSWTITTGRGLPVSPPPVAA